MTRSDRWKKRKSVVRHWEYKDYIQEQANNNNFVLQKDIKVSFHLKMPKSWSKKKQQEMFGRPHQQTPDLDNLIKAFFDSLTDDDSWIFSITAFKVWDKNGYIKVWK